MIYRMQRQIMQWPTLQPALLCLSRYLFLVGNYHPLARRSPCSSRSPAPHKKDPSAWWSTLLDRWPVFLSSHSIIYDDNNNDSSSLRSIIIIIKEWRCPWHCDILTTYGNIYSGNFLLADIDSAFTPCCWCCCVVEANSILEGCLLEADLFCSSSLLGDTTLVWFLVSNAAPLSPSGRTFFTPTSPPGWTSKYLHACLIHSSKPHLHTPLDYTSITHTTAAHSPHTHITHATAALTPHSQHSSHTRITHATAALSLHSYSQLQNEVARLH